MPPLIARLAPIAVACAIATARAAQSYDGCAGFIDTLPATISTQGVWCLRHDLSTNIASGAAITIANNNVTIDCNDFKLGGLAAGNASNASGIWATSRQNATVRHCNVRGFYDGIYLNGGAGHLVEDSRLDNNLGIAILIYGEHNLVRRNRIYDTGGRTGATSTTAINANADIVDNTIAGLFADVKAGVLRGIYAGSPDSVVRGNTVSGIQAVATTGGAANIVYGIDASGGQRIKVADNVLSGYGFGDFGIYGSSSISCAGNTLFNFDTYLFCSDDGGNVLH